MQNQCVTPRLTLQFLFWSFLLVWSPVSWAQDWDGNAQTAAMGNAGLARADGHSGLLNPASLAQNTQRTIETSVSQWYGLSELRNAQLSVTFPTRFAGLGLGFTTFGFSDYRESTLRLVAARGLKFRTTRTVSLGIEAGYHLLSIPEYGQAGAFGLSVGAQTALTPQVDWGFRLHHVNKPRWTADEPLTRGLSVGFAYHPTPALVSVLDLVQMVGFPLSVRGGFSFMLGDAVSLRAGFSTAPVQFTGGAGFQKGRLNAQVAFQQHQILGWSPHTSLGFTF